MRPPQPLVVAALAAPLGALAVCIEDECLKVVTGTHLLWNGTADCKSYLPRVTATAPASTFTVAVTVTADSPASPTVSARDLDLPRPEIPVYAWAACLSPERYQSACSRVGVFPTTVTVPGPSTTVIATSTVTPSETATPDGNIVPNGGFETGTLQGWTLAPNATAAVVSPGNNSTFSLKFGPLHDFLVHQVSTTVVGVNQTTYSCSFDWMFAAYMTVPDPVTGSVYIPYPQAFINGQWKRTGVGLQPGVYKTATFTYVSTGQDTLSFQYRSPQPETEGDNWGYLDNVSCVPGA